MTDPSKTPGAADPSNTRIPIDDGRCHAHTTAGRPCRRPPVRGATVCPSHGGAAPQVRTAAARRRERGRAAAEWSRAYGAFVVDVDPAGAVLDQISWTAGHVAWLRERVQATDPQALVWGVEREVTKTAGEYPGVDTTRAARPSVWLELYGQERDRLVRMCEIAHRMGIEERRVELAEQLGQLVAGAVQGILDDLGLDEAQWRRAAAAIPARLKQMAELVNGGGRP